MGNQSRYLENVLKIIMGTSKPMEILDDLVQTNNDQIRSYENTL